MQPKISVIIPVYNALPYLHECMESIINQTLNEIEIICVDDGSTDGSLDVLYSYAKQDERIKVISQENLHAGVARNNGLAIANGEYVHFLDADDWVEKNAYREWYAIAKEQDAEVCVCFHESFDNVTGEVQKNKNVLKNEYISVSNLKQSTKYFVYNAVVPWNKIYRKDFLVNNNIYFDDLICANDRSFYYHMLLHAERIAIVQEYWIHYRKNNQASLVGDTRLKNFDSHFRSFEKIWSLYFDEENDTKKMILDVTMKDYFNFYHKSIGTVYEHIVKEQLKEYLKKMDFSLFGEEIFQSSWYKEYAELLAIENNIDYQFFRKQRELRTVYKQRDEHRKEIAELKKKNEVLQEKISSMETSKTFKIYRSFSWLIKKIRGGIRCYKEHGLKYTIVRFAEKVNSKLNLKNHITKHQKLTFGLTTEKRNPQLIVSLTSYPGRISTVHKTIETLLKQTVKPDQLILWLAEEQFPNKINDLSSELRALQEYGLTIKWCEDLRSYKKLIPALNEYPNDIIVTADDDAYYDVKWLETLYESYQRETTQYIHCHRVTKFFCPDDEYHIISAGKITYPVPSYLHKLVGLGGVLYPPNALKDEVTNIEKFMKLAPTNDDIWFWMNAVLNKTRIKVVENNKPIPRTVEGSQDNGALTKINDSGEMLFWKDFNNLLSEYPDFDTILKEEYELMHKIDIANRVATKDKDETYYKNLDESSYKAELIIWYYRRTKKFLNLDNPLSFNEKIQWLKLYDSTPLKTQLADKFLARSWVAKKIGEEYLIPLLGVYDSYDQIEFEKLPEQFVLKANHGSGWNIIVKDKKSLDNDVAKSKFDVWMKRNFAFANGLELHYKDIPPKIVVEKYMADLEGDIFDYRFFCFNGKPEYVWVDIGSGTANHRRNIYDLEWNLQDYEVSYPKISPLPEKPDTFEQMKKLAALLCAEFSFVRVDFYSVDGKIYFGEMTFTPQSGAGVWEKDEINYLYGELIHLPNML